METEGRISRSVHTLDLRSVKEQGAGARKALMDARRSAVDLLSSPQAQLKQRQRPSSARASAPSEPYGRASPSTRAILRSPASSPAAAAAASAALAAEAQAAAANARARCTAVEAALAAVCHSFADAVTSGGYYAVTFGPGAIGMILTAAEDGSVEVAELRNDAAGVPLLARASGKVSVRDVVLAINDTWLAQHGTPTLDSVAALFKASPRPCRVLFRKHVA